MTHIKLFRYMNKIKLPKFLNKLTSFQIQMCDSSRCEDHRNLSISLVTKRWRKRLGTHLYKTGGSTSKESKDQTQYDCIR